jgi:ribosomal protein L16 Arg81 hydroxylase
MPREQGSDEPKGEEEDKPGLDDEQAEALKKLMADPKSREQIDKLLRTVKKETRGASNQEIDPNRMLMLAQGWNARIAELAVQWNTARSKNPGASTASDEALLRVYYMTPIAPWSPKDAPFPMPLEDIDEYADTVRAHLVKQGWTDIDKIEDQVTRECFPMREPLIKSGRDWQGRVTFVDQMLELTDRWLDRYGKLPDPDLDVLAATKEGKGDPESQARDTDSSAYPPGGYRNPPTGPI